MFKDFLNVFNLKYYERNVHILTFIKSIMQSKPDF